MMQVGEDEAVQWEYGERAEGKKTKHGKQSEGKRSEGRGDDVAMMRRSDGAMGVTTKGGGGPARKRRK